MIRRMHSGQSIVPFILEQISQAGHLSVRRMFGKEVIYCDGKLVAVVSDGQLFLKPTAAGRAHLGAVTERTLFNDKRIYFWISGDRWEDRDWLTQLIRVTAAERPLARTKMRERKDR